MYSDHALANALSPDLLELILLPTEKCNFRCTYCYEDFAIGRMKRSVVEGVKALISARVPHLKELSLSWFGGEPLLAKDLVMEISSFAYELCRTHNVGFAGGLTTNGYLLDSTLLESLVALNQSHFQITLDGDEEWHDKTRIQANRRPTFETIWANLCSYQKSAASFRILLRLHIHRDNVESVKRLYEKLKTTLLLDDRFSVFFHKISNLNPKDHIESVLNGKAYAEALTYVRSSDTSDNAKSENDLSDYICYAAKPNSLMIRANGTIGKCTVALDDDRNNLGHIKEDGTIELSNPKLRQWMLGYMDLSKSTLTCPLSSLPKMDTRETIPIALVQA